MSDHHNGMIVGPAHVTHPSLSTYASILQLTFHNAQTLKKKSTHELTFFDYKEIRTIQDAHRVFEAVRLGILPLIRRRLSPSERDSLASGKVFVWEEAPIDADSSPAIGGLERWTDGRRWSQSRLREPFLFYEEQIQTTPEEKKSKADRRGRKVYGPESPPAMNILQPSRQDRPTKPDGLTKQVYSSYVYLYRHTSRSSSFASTNPSMTTTGMELQPRKWHCVAYFNASDWDSLPNVEAYRELRDLVVPEGVYISTKDAQKTHAQRPLITSSVNGNGRGSFIDVPATLIPALSNPKHNPIFKKGISRRSHSSSSSSIHISPVSPPIQSEIDVSPPDSHTSSQCSSPGNVRMFLPAGGDTSHNLDFDTLMTELKKRHFPGDKSHPIQGGRLPHGSNNTSHRTSPDGSQSPSPRLPPMAEGQPYTCSLCPERFWLKESLDMHIQIHDLDRRIRLSELAEGNPLPRSVTRLKALFPTEEFDHACASYLFHSTGEWLFTVSVSRVFRVFNLRTEVPAYELRDYAFRDKDDISGQWGSNLGYVFTVDEVSKTDILLAFVAYKRPAESGGGGEVSESSTWEPEAAVFRIRLDMESRSASAKELARFAFDFVPGMMVLSGPRLFVANQASMSNTGEQEEHTILRLFAWPERRYVPIPEMLPSVYLNAYPDYFLSLGIIDETAIALQILTFTSSNASEDGNSYSPLSDSDHQISATIQLPCQSSSSSYSAGLRFLLRDAMVHHEYNGPNVNDVVVWICDNVPTFEGEVDADAWSVFEITLDFAQVLRRGGRGEDDEETMMDEPRTHGYADSWDAERDWNEEGVGSSMIRGRRANDERARRFDETTGGRGDSSSHSIQLHSHPDSHANGDPSSSKIKQIVHKRISNYPYFQMLRSLGKGFRLARLDMERISELVVDVRDNREIEAVLDVSTERTTSPTAATATATAATSLSSLLSPPTPAPAPASPQRRSHSRSIIYPIIYSTQSCPPLSSFSSFSSPSSPSSSSSSSSSGLELVAWSPLTPTNVSIPLQSSISVDAANPTTTNPTEEAEGGGGQGFAPESYLYMFDGVEASGIFL
ncbi:hypothetical protein FRC17_002288, partial [Serendipita sp. 399]